MKRQSSALILLVMTCACSGSDAVSGPDTIGTQTLDPAFDVTGVADGGTCPTVFYEHSEMLENGVHIGWRNVVADFDYSQGETTEIPLEWWIVEGAGSVTFRDFTERNGPNTWTPAGGPEGGVSGEMTLGAVGVDWVSLQLSMESMKTVGKPGDDSDTWSGRFGVGHFWLQLLVENDGGDEELVKLGVNVHLEDPDVGAELRCPGADPGSLGTPLPPVEEISY
jgi:hypothetical protein